jgi:uncharacterized protein
LTATPDRIRSLDVIRGLAVLGILAVNAPYFAAPWQTAANPTLSPLAIAHSTAWSWFVPHVFFEFKFITLFSMLFGVSVYLVGGERSDEEKGAILHRRLLWLLVFGLAHATLIWFGDILFVYALCGLIMMQARSMRAATLFIFGLSLFALSLPLTLGSGLALEFAARFMPGDALQSVRDIAWAPPKAEMARVTEAFRSGWLSATAENASQWLTFIGSGLFAIGPRTIGMMMIGLALFKWGVLSGRSPAWVYGVLIAIGLAALGAVAWQARVNLAANFPFPHMVGGGLAANTILSPLITLLYASVLILLVKANALKWFIDALAAVGRMAFTNYLTQSLIMTTIFWGGRGFGLFGDVDRPTLMYIVPAVWALQLLWSPLWLSRFTMGPFEWIWRRLSYARPVALVRRELSAMSI